MKEIDLSDTAFPLGAGVYRIVEEALTNVMRHADARSVCVSLPHAGDHLTAVRLTLPVGSAR